MKRWLQSQTMETAVGCYICSALLVVTGLAMRALDLVLFLY